jgi:hypothetical protein
MAFPAETGDINEIKACSRQGDDQPGMSKIRDMAM